MSTWRVAAIVVGCGLVAAGAAASAGACVYARRAGAAVPVAPAARPDVRTDGIGLAAIESPSPSAPTLSPHRRNLFRLRERPPVATPNWMPAAPAPAEPVDPTPASLPLPLTLAGIGESRQGDRAVRTAVISGAGELWLATEGMVLAGRYQVDRIDSDAVVLVDTASGQPRTLHLR
jgi:hypothetical protein